MLTRSTDSGLRYGMHLYRMPCPVSSSSSFQTSSALQSFFLAMTLYPEVQRRAQAELDAVVGKDRLPEFQDRDDLPYVNALCSEVVRWLTVTPLGKMTLANPCSIIG